MGVRGTSALLRGPGQEKARVPLQPPFDEDADERDAEAEDEADEPQAVDLDRLAARDEDFPRREVRNWDGFVGVKQLRRYVFEDSDGACRGLRAE